MAILSSARKLISPKHAPSKSAAGSGENREHHHKGVALSDEASSVSLRAFLEALDYVIVQEPAEFNFHGAIELPHAKSFWIWACRDVMPELNQRIETMINADKTAASSIDAVAPLICAAIEDIVEHASQNSEADRRLTVQVGGEKVRERLEIMICALRSRSVIEKASTFGRATNSLQDENALCMALQSLPAKDATLSALLMHAVVGQVSNPSKLLSAVVTSVGGSGEGGIRSAGFASLVDAILSHAQNQLAIISTNFGAFADVDLICRSLSRFHKLLRAVNGYIELERTSQWSTIVAHLTKTISAKIEPKLREVSGDVSQSLRKSRDGTDRIDSDRLLAALNGMFLLSAIRDARESLAMNALFEKVWTETGQALEILLTRNLDDYKANPENTISGQRLDYGIKMAELRFGAEYAEILRRARDKAGRRIAV